jgi:hypothetical protein
MATCALNLPETTPELSDPVYPDQDPTPTPRPIGDVRVRLASLPVPLRVEARDRTETEISIEAELPWLAVGTTLDLELPDGVQQAGRIQSFDMGVTEPGSARLRIIAELSPPGCPPPDAAARERPAGRSFLSRIWPLAFVVGACLGGYGGRQGPPLRALADQAPLRALVDQAQTLVAGVR